ncbi:co-chaperone GroES [bacterium]|nr:co-chaperone GroES [bacterium]
MMKIDVKKLKPMCGYVLVEPTEKETVTSSGIVLPTESNEKPQSGKILAIGAAGKDDPKLEAKVGDTVLYKKWGGNDVKIDDVEYQFLKYEDILAKVA